MPPSPDLDALEALETSHAQLAHDMDDGDFSDAIDLGAASLILARRLTEEVAGLRAALLEAVDFAEGVAAGSDVPTFFRNEAVNVSRLRSLVAHPGPAAGEPKP